MKRFLLIGFLGVTACTPVVPDKPMTSSEQQAFAICSAKGLSYLKDVKYFPYLADTTSLDYLVTVHVTEQCLDNSGSFGPLDGPTVLPAATQELIAR
jgi:hypothetical protein